MNKYQKKLEVSISAAVSAGEILIKHSDDFLQGSYSRKESYRDIVTEADKYTEKKIVEIIRKFDPAANILSEESGMISDFNVKSKNQYWIIDSLDGTVNYFKHIPFYGVSIAFMDKKKLAVGVIYNPFLNELFYGALGLGVYKNHKKISLQDGKPDNLLFAASFSGKKFGKNRKDEFEAFRKVNDSSMGCLRTGSAAINLAYAADGRLGGCWGRRNKLWDVAAGLLLARLAGARVEYEIVDKTKNLVNFIASAPSSFEFLKEKTLLKNYKS